MPTGRKGQDAARSKRKQQVKQSEKSGSKSRQTDNDAADALDTWTSIDALPDRGDGFQDVRYVSKGMAGKKWHKEDLVDQNPGLQGLGMLSFEFLDLSESEARALTTVGSKDAEAPLASSAQLYNSDTAESEFDLVPMEDSEPASDALGDASGLGGTADSANKVDLPRKAGKKRKRTLKSETEEDTLEQEAEFEKTAREWAPLRLHPLLIRGVARLGFTNPTPIQLGCVPEATIK